MTRAADVRNLSTTVSAVAIAAALTAGSGTAAVRAQGRTGPGSGPITLTAPATRSKAPDSRGFLRRWLILEPIRVSPQLTESAVQADVSHQYFPKQLEVVPHDGDTVTTDDGTALTWHAEDTLDYNVNLYHFADGLKQPTSNVLFWAVTVVDAPREMTGVRLAIGSNAASVWWVNGRQVIALYNDRQTVIDDGVTPRLTLHKGPNVIRAAIINAGGATDFCARLLDADDHPIENITLTLPT